MSYQPPSQSPSWDHKQPLAELMASAKFFVLLKRHPHGDLVNVATGYTTAGGCLCYLTTALSHDAAGITYSAEGSVVAPTLALDLLTGVAELTSDQGAVLRHVWESMTDHPNATKLFNQL